MFFINISSLKLAALVESNHSWKDESGMLNHILIDNTLLSFDI